MKQSQKDLDHFLKLAAAQVRHRVKATEQTQAAGTTRYLQLLEDLIKEQATKAERAAGAAT